MKFPVSSFQFPVISPAVNHWAAKVFSKAMLLILILPAAIVSGQQSQAVRDTSLDRLEQQLSSSDEESRLDAIMDITGMVTDGSGEVAKRVFNTISGILQRDSSAVVRAAAARVLFFINTPQSTETLLASLKKEKKVPIKKSIIYSLAGHPKPEVTAELTSRLKDRNSEVRVTSAFALAEINDPNSAPALIEYFNKRGKDEDVFGRANAARALGNMQYKAAETPLLNALNKDKSNYVIRFIAEALGNIASSNNPAVQHALKTALLSSDPYIVIEAERALEKIASRTETQR